MEPSLLLHHLQTKYKLKEICYFERIPKNYRKDTMVSSHLVSGNKDNKNAVRPPTELSTILLSMVKTTLIQRKAMRKAL